MAVINSLLYRKELKGKNIFGYISSFMKNEEIKENSEFKGILIITKNYNETLDYYKNFRRFDNEGRFKIKKFGSSQLSIKGFSLGMEQRLVYEQSEIENERKAREGTEETLLALLDDTCSKLTSGGHIQ